MDAELAKPLKVTIPTDLHLRLVRLKFLQGVPIAASVEAALRHYFERLEREDPALARQLRRANED